MRGCVQDLHSEGEFMLTASLCRRSTAMQINSCTTPVLLPPFLTSLETFGHAHRSSLTLPFPLVLSLNRPVSSRLLLHVLPPLILISHCNFQIFCSIFWPPSLGGKEAAHPLTFLLHSCSHLVFPLGWNGSPPFYLSRWMLCSESCIFMAAI